MTNNSRDSNTVPVPPCAISFEQLHNIELPPQQWAIEGIFENGTVSMISAKPNQFKTWFALHMAVCLAKGMPVFGKFKTEQQAVMVWNAEDGARLMKNRMEMIAPDDDALPIYFHIDHEMLLSDEVVEHLLKEIRELNVRFLIIDPLCDVHGGDENRTQDMVVVFRYLRKFAHEGITVLIIHHWRKGNGKYGAGDAIADEARGSSVIQGALNGHLSCRPAVKEADGSMTVHVTQSKLKNGEKMDPFKVRVVFSDGAVTMEHVGDAVPERDEMVERQMLAFFTGADRWVTTSEVLQQQIAGERKVRNTLYALTVSERLVMQSRKELMTNGIVLSTTTGAHNEKCYRVKNKQ